LGVAASLSIDVASIPSARPRVLVVDDDASMRHLLRLHLTNNGFEAMLAEDAIVAGHAILRDLPDLILLDVQMPYMNGYEFAAALKADELTRNIPVVFLTTDSAVAEHAHKLGAEAYLNKPVMVDRLLEVVTLFVPSSAAPRS